MKIANKEIKTKSIIYLYGGCIWTIYSWKNYDHNTKKPSFITTISEYKNKDNTINEKKSFILKGSGYNIRKIKHICIDKEKSTYITYVDNSTKEIKYQIINPNNRKYEKVEFRHPNGKIDEDRSYEGYI